MLLVEALVLDDCLQFPRSLSHPEVRGLEDSVMDQGLRLYVATPRLILKLHFEFELLVDFHEVICVGFVDHAVQEVQQTHDRLVILDDKVERRVVSTVQTDALPRVKYFSTLFGDDGVCNVRPSIFDLQTPASSRSTFVEVCLRLFAVGLSALDH